MKNLSEIIYRSRKKRGIKVLPYEERIAPYVLKTAGKISNLHINRAEKNALFIDMGSNIGQGFRYFSRYYSPNIYDYWLIEPNPFCVEQLRNSVSILYDIYQWDGKYEIKEAAVSNDNGFLKLYGLVEDDRGNVSEGASVVNNHNSKYYISNEDKALEVRSVKVSNLIDDALRHYSTIVVKMDIESAEYDVLDELISTGLIDNIEHIYVEWHSRYMSPNNKMDYKRREKIIKKRLSHKLTDWH